ncbi:cation diffusion facilitator family transporter [Acetobacter sp. TBRC 12305]|uniref:Cation transporter n=1 Tax=Acetobacter garciniae TaxID=2817435 RepID=A0A939HFU2_9PROT|nr:cation diffusion facilitator family transporter [Acetobacter garciniae]MBO1323623.1 cation transporter [Acetobacter garciniae]MBX0343312.1 cation diffusion facilitator family transporter [Acetobacter garciniae]
MPDLPLPKNNKGIAILGLLVSFLALGLKYAAYAASGSVALYADAVETIINVVAAAGGLWALSIAERPADHNHTYGHYKAEYLSAVAEGTLVVVTAFIIGREAVEGWLHPMPLLPPWRGLALNAAATVLNLGWGMVMLRAGRARRSPALVAGGQHVLSDVWTGVALVAGVALIPVTGWARLDSVMAGLVAVNVLRVGWEVMRESIAGLMDQAPGRETLEQIQDIIAANGEGAIEAHDIRTRIVGAMTFLDFHLVVPGSMSVNQAHDICDRIEAALRAHMGSTLVHIHVEPDNLAKHEGIVFWPRPTPPAVANSKHSA